LLLCSSSSSSSSICGVGHGNAQEEYAMRRRRSSICGCNIPLFTYDFMVLYICCYYRAEMINIVDKPVFEKVAI